jgi:DMSO/TMAO reductase YedYZ molybdopterin-dependent catalytic subunit
MTMDATEARRGAAAALRGAVVGLLAAAAVTAVAPSVPFPVVAVAEAIATATPGGVATFFIEALQHLALPLSVVAVAVGFLGLTWWLGRVVLTRLARRIGPFPAAVVLAAPTWAVAVLAFQPDASTVGRPAFAVILALCALLGAAVAARGMAAPEPSSSAADPSRRQLLHAGIAGAGTLALLWLPLGGWLGRRRDPGTTPLGATAVTEAPLRAARFDDVPGLTPRLTSLEDFYTVDEEFIDPDVDPAEWRLSVGGLVERPYELTYDELLAFPLVEQHATLACISNPVGGDLISTATWTGARLADLLARARPSDGAVEVVFRAIGGYSDSIPIDDAIRPVTLVAVGMNGQTLPRAHGFPARLLAPGYYGMKQPKWLTSIEVVDTPYEGYWEQRGWIKAAVVKTWSRIDGVDEPGADSWTVAGIAYAGDRRVERVEVSLDDGATWRDAEVEPPLSGLTWARWRLAFDPAGATRILVRATDGDGEVQVSEYQAPHPSGATGYDAVTL